MPKKTEDANLDDVVLKSVEDLEDFVETLEDLEEAEEVKSEGSSNLPDDSLEKFKDSDVIKDLEKEYEDEGNGFSEEDEQLLSDMNKLVNARKKLTASEKADIAKVIANMYEKSQRIVTKVVSNNKKKDSWLEFEDLKTEANIALIDAMTRFDKEKASFITYAYSMMSARVLQAQEKDPRVIKPRPRSNMDFNNLRDAFFTKYNREPRDDEELLDFAKTAEGVKRKDGKEWNKKLLKSAALKWRQNLAAGSLDASLGGGDDDAEDAEEAGTKSDMLKDSSVDASDEEKAEEKRIELIKDAIGSSVSRKLHRVLLERFIENPCGIYEDPEVDRVFGGRQNKNTINQELKNAFKNEGLVSKLKELGLFDD